MRNRRKSFVVASLVLAAVASSGLAAVAVAPSAERVSLPVHRVYRADVDGDGAIDRVVIRLGRDLRLQHQGPFKTGHYRLTVHLAAGGGVSRRLRVDAYYGTGTGPWTPWFGASQIDHTLGQELVLGRTSGAHTTVYRVLTYRRGALRVLPAPSAFPAFAPGWMVNSSYGTGIQGWQCTERGVKSRSATPGPLHHRYHLVKKGFVWNGSWQRAWRHRRAVPASRRGEAPRYLAKYGSFRCPGLPRSAF